MSIIISARCVKCQTEFSHERAPDKVADAELSRLDRVKAREHRVKCRAMIVPLNEVRSSPVPPPAPAEPDHIAEASADHEQT